MKGIDRRGGLIELAVLFTASLVIQAAIFENAAPLQQPVESGAGGAASSKAPDPREIRDGIKDNPALSPSLVASVGIF